MQYCGVCQWMFIERWFQRWMTPHKHDPRNELGSGPLSSRLTFSPTLISRPSWMLISYEKLPVQPDKGKGSWIWIQTDGGLNLGSALGSLGDLSWVTASLGLGFPLYKIKWLPGKIWNYIIHVKHSARCLAHGCVILGKLLLFSEIHFPCLSSWVNSTYLLGWVWKFNGLDLSMWSIYPKTWHIGSAQ